MLSVSQVPPPGKQDTNVPCQSKCLPLTLPAILGRGPLLKCADVKVSRRHAALDWADDDDGVVITALFSQPTFVEVSGQRSQIKTGEKATLRNGDKFGLLAHAAWYQINLPPTEAPETSKDLINSTTKDEIPIINAKAESAETSICELRAETHPAAQSDFLPENDQIASTDSTAIGSKVFTPNEASHCSPCQEVNGTSLKDGDFPASSENIIVAVSKTSSVISPSQINASNAADAPEMLSDESTTPQPANTTNDATNAVTSRVRTLPAWMMQEPATKEEVSPGKKPGSRPGQRKNTSRKPRPRVVPTKRKAEISSSDDENNEDVNDSSPSKRRVVRVSPTVRIKNTLNADSKRALHKMSESDDDVPSPALAKRKGEISSSDNEDVYESSPSKGKAKKVPPGVRIKNTDSASRKSALHEMSESDDDVPSPQAAHSTSSPDVNCKANSAVKLPDVSNDVKQLKKPDIVGQFSNGPKASSALPETEEKESGVGTINPANGSGPPSPGVSHANQSTDVAEGRGSTIQNRSKRKSCRYGGSCYRRNPQHKKDEAHPGDLDYLSAHSDDDGSDGDRPECEFGVDCYRKNPEHRRQYKHTRVPQPQRRAKRKRAAPPGSQRSDSDTPDEFDMEFLNDASSDDYAPSDSDESDSERFFSQPIDEDEKNELKRMGKEAKKFVRQRK
ncbi:aprataxin and PNK-like factor [Hyalella azteca]|uniref:Aprataxin and PNK-like factor n=1 Tax=Hyalella azteca TaxID=294128 RepID=A0A8B7PDM9_HYAAZ|nr:aprataxin and PNK-like factor [Hyalella azteca]